MQGVPSPLHNCFMPHRSRAAVAVASYTTFWQLHTLSIVRVGRGQLIIRESLASPEIVSPAQDAASAGCQFHCSSSGNSGTKLWQNGPAALANPPPLLPCSLWLQLKKGKKGNKGAAAAAAAPKMDYSKSAAVFAKIQEQRDGTAAAGGTGASGKAAGAAAAGPSAQRLKL